MAKITVTVEDDTKSPEELAAIATKAIQAALKPEEKECDHDFSGGDSLGNVWCTKCNKSYY